MGSSSFFHVTSLSCDRADLHIDCKEHRDPEFLSPPDCGIMAMLAEPRRKQKWSVDPRNSTWSKDESKFGQKMLEKMGWSKGKGLGAQEQGATEHIRVQVKNNTLGLGASNHHEDNWIAHQDDFNQLLAELNDCHGTASSASSDNENKKSFNLEEKSKASKKRVHYMKFAKGKDLSCRSNSDLACIFGKREKAKKSRQEETDSEPDESESPSPTTEAEPGNIVTSSLSVNEYFAKRMAQLKKSHGKPTEIVTKSGEQRSEDIKKKSTKRKRRKNDDAGDPEEPKVVENLQNVNHVDTRNCQERRKKPKSKREDKVPSVDNSDHHEELEDQDETRAKSKREDKVPSVDISEHRGELEDQDETRKKKKKKKRKEELCDWQTEDVTSTPGEDIETEQPKKKKRRKLDRTEA